MRITCTVAFWTATYVQWQPITALPSSPGESLGCSRTNSTTCWINFTFSPPSCGKTQNLLWSHLVCEGKGQRGAKLRRAPYGWMRFHRGTLSVAGLNPWAVTVISAAAESEKKFPQLLPLSASDRQSVTEWNAEESAPAPHWPCHILSSHVFLSLHHPSSIHPSALSDVCLYTFTEHHPPPPRSGRHSNGWFRKGGRVSQRSCCSAPCGAFTGYFCFCAAFMALPCWQFRWLSHKLISHTKAVCLLLLKDTIRITIYAIVHLFPVTICTCLVFPLLKEGWILFLLKPKV